MTSWTTPTDFNYDQLVTPDHMDAISTDLTYLLENKHRNWIINGDFSVNQRAFSSVASPTIGQNPTVDRWFYYTQGAATISLQTAALGDLPRSSRNFLRVDLTTDGIAYVRQPIESVRSLSGETITVSFYAKAAAQRQVSVGTTQDFGATGSPSTAVSQVSAPITIGTSWARYSATFTLAPITGKTLGSNGKDALHITIYLSGSDGGLALQTGAFDIWGVQAEVGNVATPFEFRPPADQLIACQRYYQSLPANSLLGIFNSASAASLFRNLPVSMRVAPALTLPAVLTNSVGDAASGTFTPTGSSNVTTPDSVWLLVTGMSGATVSLPARWISATPIVANAELILG